MPNSSVTLQELIDNASSLGDVSPALATGGFAYTPALSIADDVMQAMVNGGSASQPYNWKWNRFNVRPFPTISYQQDYYVPGVVNLGWIESAWAVFINQTVIQKQKQQLEAKKDLEVSSDQSSYPGKICWLPNDILQYGTWGAAPLGPTVEFPSGQINVSGRNQSGLQNPGPNVVYTNPYGTLQTPINATTCIRANNFVPTQASIRGTNMQSVDMGVRFIQGNSTNVFGTAPSLVSTFTSNNTAGNCLIIDVNYAEAFNGEGVLTISDSQGNTYTNILYHTDPYPGANINACWIALNCKAGPNTVTVAYSDGGFTTSGVMAIHEYAGVVSVDASDFNTDTSFPVSASVNTTGVGELLHFAVMASKTSSFPTTTLTQTGNYIPREANYPASDIAVAIATFDSISGIQGTYSNTGNFAGSGPILFPCVFLLAMNQPNILPTVTVSWPTGTQVGDLAVITHSSETFRSFPVTPTGWTLAQQSTGENWTGCIFTKILNSQDIANGSVVISEGTSYINSVDVAITTFVGAPAIREIDVIQNAGTATSIVTSNNVLSTDFMLAFGSGQSNASTGGVANPFSVGTTQASAYISNHGGAVCAQPLIVDGQFVVTFTDRGNQNLQGQYQVVIILEEVPVPVDNSDSLWVLTTFGTCGSTYPNFPLHPSYPTVSNPSIVADTVLDGTAVWTAVNPKGQGFRLNPIPPQTGVVWEIQVVAQMKAPRFKTVQQTLEPVPDDYEWAFKQGFFAECYRRNPDPKVRAKYPMERQLWLEALDRAVRQADREEDDYGFYPGQSIMETGVGVNPISPAMPYGPWNAQ